METVKLVEVIGDKLVQLSTVLSFCYGIRLMVEYLKYRLDKTGEDVFPEKEKEL